MLSLKELPQHPILCVTLLAGSTYIIYRLIQHATLTYRRSIIIQQNGCKPCPKAPQIDPIFGLDVFYEMFKNGRARKFNEWLTTRFKEFGNTHSVQLDYKVFRTIDPDNIKTALSTKFHDFKLPPTRHLAFVPMFGKGIFTNEDADWEHSRALLRPSFTRKQVADLDLFESHATKMLERIPKKGETVDLSELFLMLTLDSASEFLFGQSTDTLGEGSESSRGAQFGSAVDYASEVGGKLGRMGKIANLFIDKKKHSEAIKCAHAYVRAYVDQAIAIRDGASDWEKETGSERYVFLEELAKTGCSAQKIQDELLNILLAGRDTTASLLTLLWWVLARRQDVFKKLRAEVMALGTERPTLEQIKDMKYLRWCLNETLRLYPTAVLNGRQAKRDTVLPRGGGADGKSPILVKKGERIMWSVWALHRRKDIYGEDADEFRPERWEKLRVTWEYIPFNGGPRICIGQQYALAEASYTTIRLLQAFSGIEAREDNPFEEGLTITMTSYHGAKVGLTPA